MRARVLDDIVQRGRLPLVVGGSGLYLRALFDGLSPYPEPAPELVTELCSRLGAEGPGVLHRELAKADPPAAAKIRPRDGQRLVRALALIRACGESLNALRAARPPEPLAATVLFVGLWRPRQELYARIDARVEAMMARGWVDEMRGLLARGYDPQTPGLAALGYRELVAYLDGACDLGAAVTAIRRGTRRLAKRQLTWFRGDQRVNWIRPEVKTAQASVQTFVERHRVGSGSATKMLAV